MRLTDKLDELMSEKGLNKSSLSKESGVPYMTIVNFYENGTDNVKLSTLKKLADYFECGLDFLVNDTEITKNPLVVGELVNIPIVGKISCGRGILAFDDIQGYELTPKEWLIGGEYFYLTAKGDSMSGARIYEGDLLLIRKQSDVENGEIAAVIIGDEAVLKRIYKNGTQLVLQSENPNYPPVFAPPSDATIIGKLKRSIIKY